jgi:hypothetical protein
VYLLLVLLFPKIIIPVRQGLSFDAADGTSLHRPLKILSSNMVKQENKFLVANQENTHHLQMRNGLMPDLCQSTYSLAGF